MDKRLHKHEEHFAVSPGRAFEILITPSAIRGWWGASRAIVLPQKDGYWSAAWGDEDEPDYISVFAIAEFSPPRKLVLKNGKYFAKTDALPFEFDPASSTIFTVEPVDHGCILRVVQDGFPADPIADDFYTACETGWKNTFEGIRKFLEENFSD